MILGRFQFLHIDHGAIGDAAAALEPGAAFALQFIRSLRFAPQQRVGAKHGNAPGHGKSIQSK